MLCRVIDPRKPLQTNVARVAKLADARDLKSRVPKGTYRFDSGPGHHSSDPSLRARDFGCRLPLAALTHACKAPQLKIPSPERDVPVRFRSRAPILDFGSRAASMVASAISSCQRSSIQFTGHLLHGL
jgi:hypothetical protein